MNSATYERAWRWAAGIVPCFGVAALLAFGWESLPPWHRPSDRVWRLEAGGAPLDRFALRDTIEPVDVRSMDSSDEPPDDRAGSSDLEDRTSEEAPLPLASLPTATREDEVATAVADVSEKRYWLNVRSGVRHNADCRYFDPSGNGRYCTADEGRACRLCGG